MAGRKRKCYKESCLIIGACCGGFGRYYRKFGCRHFTPLLILVGYTVIAALILHCVESGQENERENGRIHQIEALRNDTSIKLAAVLSDTIMSDETKIMQTRDWVRWYEKQLGLNQEPTTHWDMWGALFYVGTIYTTIGYGNISPSTSAGRLLTVVYAIFGIPLVLAILNDLGQLLRQGINRSWNRLINIRRRLYRPPSSSKSASTVLTVDDDAEEGDEPSPIPITVALSLTVGWMLLCSAVFCIWETNWSYGTSLYFFFISLSTIGLGDVVPEKPHYMIANFGFVIIGLCLVSMTLGVIQQRIEEFLYRMMKLIRQEYEAATERAGRGGRCKVDRILENVWKKQPWHVRLLAPHLLSDQSKSRLDRCAVRLVRGEPFRIVARDLMVYKSDHSLDVDSPHPRVNNACCHRLEHCESNYSSPSQRLLCDTSTQTDRVRPFTDLILLENEQFMSSSYRRLSRTERHASYLPHRPQVRDQSVQACIRIQTAHVAVGEITNTGKKKKNRSKSASITKKTGNHDTQTTSIFERGVVECAEKTCQTDDSYLKLASKLEALRTNRADSLAIMVTPGARKPSLPGEGPAK